MASKEDSTSGATPPQGEAARPMTEVGGVRSSDDPVPDLWFGENAGERRDATCSAGEKRREGRGDGPQGLPAPEKVRQLQITLYRKAKSSPGYRFWSLYGEVQRADVLGEAWRRVKANGGSAGVDGVTIEELTGDAQKEAAWLSALREELHRKTSRPAPVRRVYIPKASGGVRPLGIPTVKDRVVQMAVYLVLMPIFEADFHPHSYGFRPKRRAQQAVAEIRRALRTGRTEVVDADLAQYFDTIPHRELLRQVARRVSDGMILKLIKGWLRAPSVEEKEGGGRTMKTNTCGTPQGGVISPLLANIYLHPLDEEINGQTSAKARMVRYADDLVICCPAGKGVPLKERLTQWLRAKGLALNERKTRIVQSRESGFVFLGFAFRWQRSRHGKEYVHVCPSPAAEQALREKIRGMTHHETTWKDPADLVGEINQVTRGWAQYFAASHHARSFRQLSHFVAERVRRWLRSKHHTEGMYERWPDEVLHGTYGLERLNYVWMQPS